MGPKTKIFCQRSSDRREELKAEGVKRAQRSRWMVWMKKVRKVRWHGVVRETLKAQASNYILDPRLNWKRVECSKQ